MFLRDLTEHATQREFLYSHAAPLRGRPVGTSLTAAIASAGLIGSLLAGCATTLSAEDEANAAGVKVAIDRELARDCTFIGMASADREKDRQRKAAWIGGNVAVITTESQEARASAAWYRSVTSTTEVYRCEGAR